MPETLQTIVESLDGVNEALHPFYEEMDDGRHRLSVDGLNGDGDVEKLRRTLAAVRKEKSDAEKRLSGLDKYKDVDLDEYAQLKAAAEEAETKKAEEKGEYDKLLTKQREALQAQIDEANEARDAARKSLEEHLLDAEAVGAMSEAGVKHPRKLKPHVRSALRAERGDDGQHRVFVIDDEGNRRLRDSDGQPFTASDLLAELRKDPEFQDDFQGRGASGGGTHGSENGSSGRTFSRSDLAGMDPAKQMEIGKKAAKGEVTIED